MAALTEEAAFTHLGLAVTATQAQVKRAWKERAMVQHPDRGGDPAQFDQLRAAYTLALQAAGRPLPCGPCQGTGKVTKAHGFSQLQVTCRACCGAGTLPREAV